MPTEIYNFFELSVAFELAPEEAIKHFQSKDLKASFSWMDMIAEENDAAFTVTKSGLLSTGGIVWITPRNPLRALFYRHSDAFHQKNHTTQKNTLLYSIAPNNKGQGGNKSKTY